MHATSLLAITIACCLLYSTNVKSQEPGTLLDCIDTFYDGLVMWDSETVDNPRDAICRTISGKASVTLNGRSSDNFGYRRFVHAFALRGARGEKQCLVQMFRDEQNPRFEELGRYSLRGRDASQWNRFLKGDGCADAQGLAGN